jgi:hypothetical protein
MFDTVGLRCGVIAGAADIHNPLALADCRHRLGHLRGDDDPC